MGKYRGTTYTLMLFLSFALLTTPSDAKVPVRDPLHEKLDFLKANLEHYLSHSVTPEQAPDLGSITFEAVSFDTCKITWKITTAFNNSAEMPMRMRGMTLVNRASLNLSSIDVARTRIYVVESMKQRHIPWSLALQLSTRAGTPGFTEQIVTTIRGQVTRTPVMQERQFAFFFDLRDQRLAEAVSQAFADASAICRSTPQRAR